MKAWRVEPIGDPYYEPKVCDGFGPIFHAETREQAKADARRHNLGVYTWTELRAVRAPEFDDKPLVPRTFLENGWWYECGHCEKILTIDGPAEWEDDYDTAPGVVYDDGGHPYCTRQCLDAERRERAEYKAVLAARAKEAGVE